jgi:hypothetical protein
MPIDIEAEVQSALPQVLSKMREQIAERVASRVEYTALEEVSKAAREWAIANLVPEINAQLEAGKAGMVAMAAEIAQSLGKALGEAMQAQAKKTLESSHTVKDIAEKLFRGY